MNWPWNRQERGQPVPNELSISKSTSKPDHVTKIEVGIKAFDDISVLIKKAQKVLREEASNE